MACTLHRLSARPTRGRLPTRAGRRGRVLDRPPGACIPAGHHTLETLEACEGLSTRPTCHALRSYSLTLTPARPTNEHVLWPTRLTEASRVEWGWPGGATTVVASAPVLWALAQLAAIASTSTSHVAAAPRPTRSSHVAASPSHTSSPLAAAPSPTCSHMAAAPSHTSSHLAGAPLPASELSP